ncbi:MAG: TonB-dependent receptor, partial [Stenotrophomonas sp.]
QMSYEYKKWSLWYGLEWIDDQDSYAYYAEGDADALAGLKDTYQLHVDDYYNSHASLTYKADKWTIIGGIRNIADRQPPKISTGVVASFANAPLYSGYDYLGRSYFLTFTKEF